MAAAYDDDVAAALAEFLASRIGVRGLVESGVASVPPLFLVPTTLFSPTLKTATAIPTVDLSLPRSTTVSLVGAAARTCGFFHVVNHGVQADAVVSAVRAFHEQPLAVRSSLYTVTPVGAVIYCNVPYAPGLYASPVVPWRDCLRVSFAPPSPDLSHVPAACRAVLLEYHRSLTEFGKRMAGMLFEALGVGAERLEVEGLVMAGHYYPPCPEPARVVGSIVHTDPSMFTVLAQDDIGGLEVRDARLEDGAWVEVPPVPGALLVNIGDVLKMISNDEYKSVEHRVRVKSSKDARVSVPIFFNPAKSSGSDMLGPLPELVTPETPARYRSFTMSEFMEHRKLYGHVSSSKDRFWVADNKCLLKTYIPVEE